MTAFRLISSSTLLSATFKFTEICRYCDHSAFQGQCHLASRDPFFDVWNAYNNSKVMSKGKHKQLRYNFTILYWYFLPQNRANACLRVECKRTQRLSSNSTARPGSSVRSQVLTQLVVLFWFYKIYSINLI